MSQSLHERYPDVHHDVYSRTTFGFWIYLLTDAVLFGTLLVTYAVLVKQTFGGPSADQLFDLPFLLVQALILLTCSFTAGMGGTMVHRRNKPATIGFFILTFFLGVIFMWMQWGVFAELLQAGHHWRNSAFLSAYFTLVGTHALHVLFGLLWIPVLLIPLFKREVDGVSIRRLTCLRMFWQFLNLIWVIIFSFVYLMGVK